MSYENFSSEAQKLISSYGKARKFENKYNENEEEKIKVHQVSGKLAFLYEKLRNTVDYKEDHLLRKNAIERILKRRIMTEKNESDVAKYMVYELIRARYLPDKEIPESRIKEIGKIIEKYTYLLNNIPSKKGGKKESTFDWIIGVASCELEEKLVPHEREKLVVGFATNSIKNKIKLDESVNLTPQELNDLVYIAVLKVFSKADISMTRYRFFLRKNPDWQGIYDRETILQISEVMNQMMYEVDSYIDHKYSENFLRAVKKNLAYLEILQEILSKQGGDLQEFFSSQYGLEDSIRETCVYSYKKAKAKLKRAAVRSILYIFITKIILALLLELPFDLYIMKEINYLALGVNILFPVALMSLIVLTIKVPGKSNTDLIVKGIKEMLYNKKASSQIIIKDLSRNSFFMNLFRFLYLIIFMISFGSIIWFLRGIGFNIASIILFIFFLTVVSYFGIRIRQNARELVVLQRKEGVASFVVDLFSIPILQAGYWLSNKISRINVFVFVFDFIVEAPFKAFVEIFEEWIYYLKEERDKIR